MNNGNLAEYRNWTRPKVVAHVALYVAKNRPEKKIRKWDKAVSFIDGSPYSHAELAFKLAGDQYLCMSSSIRDNGVRVKIMALPEPLWVLKPALVDIDYCFEWIRRHEGDKYDWQGLIRTKLEWWPDRSDYFFCSEAVAELLGLANPTTYGPKKLSKWLDDNPVPAEYLLKEPT